MPVRADAAPMHALYGVPAPGLAIVPADSVQCSPLLPGSAAMEDFGTGRLAGFVMTAPRGTLERRYALALLLRALRPGAAFAVLAPKKQGGARLFEELTAFGCMPDEVSRQHHRICSGQRPEVLSGIEAAIVDGAPRLIEALGLWSQPGIFSWDRIDAGSALLIDHLPQLAGRGGDLGCGLGVLARAVLAQATVQHVTLIDLDRRAVEAARRNVEASRTTVVWADVATTKALPAGLDFVVMNPPFHDGGTQDQNLGRAFIAKAAAALRDGGICLLVANRHLPYEAAMKPMFTDVTQLMQIDGYKVYQARK